MKLKKEILNIQHLGIRDLNPFVVIKETLYPREMFIGKPDKKESKNERIDVKSNNG